MSHKGLAFLIEFYDVEHLQSMGETIEDVLIICQKMEEHYPDHHQRKYPNYPQHINHQRDKQIIIVYLAGV